MPRQLTFKIGKKEFSVYPVKVDRRKLYGWTELMALDDNGEPCQLLTADESGKYIIPLGGTGMGIMSASGKWIERSELQTVNADGKPAPLFQSSFEQVNTLSEKITPQEFLNYSITDFYQLTEAPSEMIRLISDNIYIFEYSYNDSYDPAPAFILVAENILYLMTGVKNRFEYLCFGDCETIDEEQAFEAQTETRNIRTILKNGQEKQNIRILKSTVQMDEDTLFKQYGSWEKTAQSFIDGDPEIDMEITGKKINRTHRLWVDKNNNIAYRVNLFRILYNPDGSERERLDINKLPGNINKEFPLKWTGKMFSRKEAVRLFVFTKSYQIRHINGATFDFLFAMAKELDEKDSLVMIGGGEKGKDPLLLSRGGQPYRAFLEGRVQDEKYILILHLTDIELKTPEQ